MITMYTNPKNKHEKKLLNEAQQMLSDSKTKVEVLKMKIMRLNVINSAHKEEEGETERSQKLSKSAPTQSPDGRIAMLRYRVDVETRLMQGAKSIIKANPKAKSSQSVSEYILLYTCVLCRVLCIVTSILPKKNRIALS